MQKRVPLTTVIGIVVAFISMRILNNITDWGGIVSAVVSLGIALLIVLLAVFIGGALGMDGGSSAEENQRA